MKRIQFAALLFIAVGCAWRFADDEVKTPEQIVVRYGEAKPAARVRATGGSVVVELFESDAEERRRGSLSLDQLGACGLTLHDDKGNARFHVTTDANGATSLGITDGRGRTVWGVDVDARGQVKIKNHMALTPAEQR